MRSIEDHPGPVLQHAAAYRGEYEDEDFFSVLGEVSRILEEARIPYVFMGGLAASSYGRPRWTHDLDVFVKPKHALPTLDLLKGAEYVTERTDEAWLYKGFKSNVMVDVIFKSRGGIYLDDEMFRRSVLAEFETHPVRLIPPEDLVVIKAAVHDEAGPRHWHDALGVLTRTDLDWEYLIERSKASPRRVLAMLLYAQSNDLVVPDRVIRRIFQKLYDS